MAKTEQCYGHYVCGAENCRRCEYSTSCQLYTQTEGRMNRPLGGQCFDEVSSFAVDLATPPVFPDSANAVADNELAPDNDTPIDITAHFSAFLHFLLSLDDYTLGILAEIIQPNDKNHRIYVAQLARIRNISRQGMHRKLLDTARKSPELAMLLKCVVLKIRKSKQEFVRKDSPRETDQLTFQFD